MTIGDPWAGRKIVGEEFCARQEKNKSHRIQKAMTTGFLTDFWRCIAIAIILSLMNKTWTCFLLQIEVNLRCNGKGFDE